MCDRRVIVGCPYYGPYDPTYLPTAGWPWKLVVNGLLAADAYRLVCVTVDPLLVTLPLIIRPNLTAHYWVVV